MVINRSAWPVNNLELGLNEDVFVDSVEVYELRPFYDKSKLGGFPTLKAHPNYPLHC